MAASKSIYDSIFILLNQSYIGGNSIFGGSIYSGPLELDNIDPSNNENEIIYNAGTGAENFYRDLEHQYGSALKYTIFNGYCNDIGFTFIQSVFEDRNGNYSLDAGPWTWWCVGFFNKERELLFAIRVCKVHSD